MFNVGGGELLVILLIALMVLGPDRLPGFAKKAGKVMADVRRISQGFQSEIRSAMELDDDTPARPRAVDPAAPATPRLVDPPTPAGGPPTAEPPRGDASTPPATEPGDSSSSGSSAA